MNWYLTFKYLHVLFAITAVGANLTYAVWGARAKSDKEHLGFALRGIKFLDDRVANPAYGGLLISGLAMTIIGPVSLTKTRFAQLGLLGFIVVAAIAGALYTPTLKKQIQALDESGPESPAFRALDQRGTIVGIVIGVALALIVLDMVFKPTF